MGTFFGHLGPDIDSKQHGLRSMTEANGLMDEYVGVKTDGVICNVVAVVPRAVALQGAP